MTDYDEDIHHTLQALDGVPWDAAGHRDRLEQELHRMHTSPPRPSFINRHRYAFAALLLLIVSGGVAGGTYAWLTRVHQYSFEVRLDGAVISRPRVLVNRGQTASVTVGNERQSFKIFIEYDGSTSIEGPEGIDMDVEIVEIELDE